MFKIPKGSSPDRTREMVENEINLIWERINQLVTAVKRPKCNCGNDYLGTPHKKNCAVNE